MCDLLHFRLLNPDFFLDSNILRMLVISCDLSFNRTAMLFKFILIVGFLANFGNGEEIL